jgi:glycosyltransferase involved in cell wall biosynthesis
MARAPCLVRPTTAAEHAGDAWPEAVPDGRRYLAVQYLHGLSAATETGEAMTTQTAPIAIAPARGISSDIAFPDLMPHTDSHVTLSIVVPVYRSALILPKLVEEVANVLEQESSVDTYELVLVNDSSPDNSWEVIRELAARWPFVRGINLRRNAGQHNAVMAGLNHARGDFIVTMDDDLQQPPREIPCLLKAVRQGYDVCYTRYNERKHAHWKQLGSQFNDWVATRLIGKPRGLYLSSFRCMRKEIAEEICKYDGPYAYVDGLILDVTSSITSVDIRHQARYEGESNYNLRRLISLWLKMATSFSVFPLRIATILGFVLAGVSAALIIFIIAMKLTHPAYPAGWASIMSAILVIGSIQTLCIGLIGEYLGRTYLKLNHKPQFVVGATTWQRGKDAPRL